MSGIASNLYNNINKKISTTTTMKSALSFYNDKEMTKQMTQYKKDIKSWETKLSDMEDRYYKQFSAMETALSKLCLLYTSPSPRDGLLSRMPSSA